MKLIHEQNMIPVAVKDMAMNMNVGVKCIQDGSSGTFEVKEKRSSSASLRLMNPVASGDNMAVSGSAHKLKEELPPLVPCCEGKELQVTTLSKNREKPVPVKIRAVVELEQLLIVPVQCFLLVQINEDLVRSGLSAISVKHDSVIQCLSMSRACERVSMPPGIVKHRNSYRCLHRPDLKRVPYLRRLSPDELETIFRGYADDLSLRGLTKDENRITYPPDENIRARDQKDKEALLPEDVNGANPLRPIPETRSGAEDVPAGMRLHGARARLYTSVLAGAKAGDQMDGTLANEEYDTRVPDDPLLEDEVQLTEELQIILPPRCDDITAESSATTTSNDS